MITIDAAIHLSVVGITYLLLLFYMIRFVQRYKHEFDSNRLCTLVVILCLLVVLMATFILPADIFLASFVKLPDGTFKPWATNETLASIDKLVYGSYYTFYGTVTFLILVVIPFMHFLNDSSESNTNNRVITAAKFTAWFVLAAALLILIGAFLPTKEIRPNNSTTTDKELIIKFNQVQDAINLILTALTLAGLINVTFYTASGIVSWPISLLLGVSRLSQRTNDINERELDLRLRITTLQEKARTTNLTKRETDALTRAQDEIRMLENEEAVLNEYTQTWTYKARKLIRPIQIVSGVFFVALALLLVVNLGIVNVDRIMHGAGPKQGYNLAKPVFFNPLQYVFLKIHDLILIGPMPLLIINCFLVIATISGMRNLGLWFLIQRIHKIRVKKTHPQAMLFFCVAMMLAVLAYNVLFYSLTPDYVTFGSQNYQQKEEGKNSTVVLPCSNEGKTSDCIRTRSSILVMGMMSQVWVFGAIFYWMTWAFMFVSFVSLIVYSIRGRREAFHGLIAQDEFED